MTTRARITAGLSTIVLLGVLLDALSDRWGLLMATILLALAACASVLATGIVYLADENSGTSTSPAPGAGRAAQACSGVAARAAGDVGVPDAATKAGP